MFVENIPNSCYVKKRISYKDFSNMSDDELVDVYYELRGRSKYSKGSLNSMLSLHDFLLKNDKMHLFKE